MPTLDKTPVEHTPDSADTQSTAPVPEAVTEGSPDPAPPNLVRNRYADTMNKPRRRLPKPVRIVLWIVLLLSLIHI